MSIFKKEVKLDTNTFCFKAGESDVYDRVLNLAVQDWLSKGNTIRFVSDSRKLKKITQFKFDNEDLKKAIIEYVLTHEQEFKEILENGFDEGKRKFNGTLCVKGDNFILDFK